MNLPRSGKVLPSKHTLPRKGIAPIELSEQIYLASVLDQTPGFVWCAVPNAGKRSARTGSDMKRSGLKPGFPDCLVFTRPPAQPDAPGTAFEMKRSNGVPSDVKPEQRQWLDTMRSLGWATFVGYGANDALVKLAALGYAISPEVLASLTTT